MNNLKEVYETLMAIAGTRKSTEKKAILKPALESALFRKVLQYAMDDDRQYYNKKLPESSDTSEVAPDDNQTAEMFLFLNTLRTQGSCTKKQKEYANQLGQDNFYVREIMYRCFQKDLRCGIGAKLVNSIVKDLVFDVPYQRCVKVGYPKLPAYSQLKADGSFAYMFAEPHPRTGKHFLTRNGSGYNLFGHIHNNVPTGHVLIGENLVLDECGVLLPRKQANGLLDKFIEGTGDAELASRVRAQVWGLITREEFFAHESEITYDECWETLGNLIFDSKVSLVETKVVHTIKEAQQHYKQVRRRGLEGTVLKDGRLTWQYNKSPMCIKVKNEGEAEFEIVEAYSGKEGKKYANSLGGLVIKSSCGGLLTKVGSGFSDSERELGVDWWNDRAGGIITCAFVDVVTDKTDRETKALENASFIETRFHDKAVADTLQYCEEQCV